MFKLSHRSINRLNGVKAILIVIATDSIKDAPYDFGIADLGGLRSAVEQHRLYVNKKSQKDGYFRKSKHQEGEAFDIVCYKDGEITWDADVFTEVANHIMTLAKDKYNIDLVWGGHWKSFKDMPHFQI